MAEDTGYLEGKGYDKWCSELGVPNSPLTRRGISTSLQFFHRHMPDLPRDMAKNFMKAMDLHKAVAEVSLSKDTKVAAFRKMNENPFKLFYTRPGYSMYHAGINPTYTLEAEQVQDERKYFLYVVKTTAVALQSYAAPAKDTWTDPSVSYLASGGAIQYLIPNSYLRLELKYAKGFGHID